MPSHTALERLRRRREAALPAPQGPVAPPGLLAFPAPQGPQGPQAPLAPVAPRGTPIRDALRRAAIGFAAGVAATPAQAGQAPGLGGAIGALGGLGTVLERAGARRRKREERLLEPQRERLRETARQEARRPFRTAEFERTRKARLERDRLRAAQVSSRDVQRAQRAAAKGGISVSEALRLRQQARSEVTTSQGLLGNFPGNPAFELAVDLREDELVKGARRVAGGKTPRALGARGGDLGNLLFPQGQ